MAGLLADISEKETCHIKKSESIARALQGLNPFTVERDGQGKNTRYAIKGLDLHRKGAINAV